MLIMWCHQTKAKHFILDTYIVFYIVYCILLKEVFLKRLTRQTQNSSTWNVLSFTKKYQLEISTQSYITFYQRDIQKQFQKFPKILNIQNSSLEASQLKIISEVKFFKGTRIIKVFKASGNWKNFGTYCRKSGKV